MDNVKQEENHLIEQYQQQTTYQENKNNKVNTEIQEQNKLNNDITNHKTKVNSYNNMVKNQNNGKK